MSTVSHTRTVLSALPVASVLPSGLNAMLMGLRSVCPVSFRFSSQRRSIPQPHGMIVPIRAPPGKRLSIRTDYYINHIAGTTGARSFQFPRLGIPQVDCPIPALTEQRLPIRTECDIIDISRPPGDYPVLFPRRRYPTTAPSCHHPQWQAFFHPD